MIKKQPSNSRIALGLAFALLVSTPQTWAADSAQPEPGTIHLDAKTSAKALKILREGMHAKGPDNFWPSIHACEALTLAGHGDEVTKFLTPKLKTEKDDQHRCGLARELVRAGDRSKTSIMFDILAGETHSDEFKKMNPNTRIPVLVLNDGRTLTEPNAILNFLADGSELLPPDQLLRAQVLQWRVFEQYNHKP